MWLPDNFRCICTPRALTGHQTILSMYRWLYEQRPFHYLGLPLKARLAPCVASIDYSDRAYRYGLRERLCEIVTQRRILLLRMRDCPASMAGACQDLGLRPDRSVINSQWIATTKLVSMNIKSLAYIKCAVLEYCVSGTRTLRARSRKNRREKESSGEEEKKL